MNKSLRFAVFLLLDLVSWLAVWVSVFFIASMWVGGLSDTTRILLRGMIAGTMASSLHRCVRGFYQRWLSLAWTPS